MLLEARPTDSGGVSASPIGSATSGSDLRVIADAGVAANAPEIDPQLPHIEEASTRTYQRCAMDAAFWFWDGFTDFLVFWFGTMRFEHVEAEGGKKSEFKRKVILGQKKIKNKLGTRETLGRKWAQLGHFREKKRKPQIKDDKGEPQSPSDEHDPPGMVPLPAYAANVKQQAHKAWDWIEENVLPEDDADSDDEFEFIPPRIPVFTILWPTIAMCLWVIFSLSNGTEEGGLESIWPHKTDLALSSDNCDDLRGQVWRWFTYQFTHVGFAHVAKNCLMMLILGWALEGASWSNDGSVSTGAWRMAVMFNTGVFGGACFYFVLDCHSRTVGMSGGVYSLIGISMADIVMNLETEHAFKILGALCFMVVVDIVEAHFSATTGVSHAAHLGGGIFGVFIGMLIGKNTRVMQWERVVRLVAGLGFLMVTLFCVIWLAQWAPRTIDEAFDGSPGWCWKGQVLNFTEFSDLKYHCVRCADKACIDMWSVPNQKYSLSVGLAACEQHGWARSPEP
jgi:membrane associated rhomboid family serine protease